MCSGRACLHFDSIRVVVHECVLVNVCMPSHGHEQSMCVCLRVGRGEVGSRAGGCKGLSPPHAHLETESWVVLGE
jgi:hypothetical protein